MEPTAGRERLRSMRRISTRLAVLAALATVLGGCAAPDAPGGSAQPPPTPSPTPAATVLTITTAPSQGARVRTWTLTCQPPAGSHPKAQAACAFVGGAEASLLAPVPANQACTQIFGGSQIATVKGTWRGTPVDARLARTNGCEISRWDKVKALVGEAS